MGTQFPAHAEQTGRFDAVYHSPKMGFKAFFKTLNYSFLHVNKGSPRRFSPVIHSK